LKEKNMSKMNALLSTSLFLLISASAQAACPEVGALRNEMLRYINDFRAQGGTCGGTSYPAVAPLALNTYLINAAASHAWDMAQNNYFSHTGRNGSSPTDRIRATGYLDGAGAWSTGENIGAGTVRNTAWAQFAAWKASASHCAAMLNGKFQHMGIACSYNAGSTYGHYWVLDLGRGGKAW
jgi:uncharacterized protein YkwD